MCCASYFSMLCTFHFRRKIKGLGKPEQKTEITCSHKVNSFTSPKYPFHHFCMMKQMATFLRNMSVSFRRALLLTVAMDLFLSVDLDHSRNEGEKKLLRRENEGERLKETTNKTQQKKRGEVKNERSFWKYCSKYFFTALHYQNVIRDKKCNVFIVKKNKEFNYILKGQKHLLGAVGFDMFCYMYFIFSTKLKISASGSKKTIFWVFFFFLIVFTKG